MNFYIMYSIWRNFMGKTAIQTRSIISPLLRTKISHVICTTFRNRNNMINLPSILTIPISIESPLNSYLTLAFAPKIWIIDIVDFCFFPNFFNFYTLKEIIENTELTKVSKWKNTVQKTCSERYYSYIIWHYCIITILF